MNALRLEDGTVMIPQSIAQDGAIGDGYVEATLEEQVEWEPWTIDYVEKAGPPDEPRDDHGRWTDGSRADLPETQRATLAKVERDLHTRNRGVRGGTGTEQLVAIDDMGGEMFRKSGTQRHVVFTREEVDKMRGPGVVLTHNHPDGDGYPFSPADIKLAQRVNAAEMRVVGDKAVYRMRPGEKGWPSPMVLDMVYNRHWNTIKIKFQSGKDEAKRLMAMPAGEERTQLIKAYNKAARADNKDVNFTAQHETWLKVAPELGLRYERHLRGDA